MYTRPYEMSLYHYGVKGMKWGIRRDRSVSNKMKSYRTSRKTDQKTDFLKLNRPNSAARSYYRSQRTKNLQTYQKQTRIMERKMSGLSKEQIDNGRYRIARARNIKRKTMSALLGAGTAAATVGVAGPAAIPLGALVATGSNFLNGGFYYGGESATYGKRRAERELKKK